MSGSNITLTPFPAIPFGEKRVSLGRIRQTLFRIRRNFHVVEPGYLFRSGQLTNVELHEVIREHGIRTLLRLRRMKDSAEDPRLVTTPLGIEFKNIPFSARYIPNQSTLRELWDTLSTARYPMLVTCRGGADRSGLASALYVLYRTQDLSQARRQLAFFPYRHLGYFSYRAMDDVLNRYEPAWRRGMNFGDWLKPDDKPIGPLSDTAIVKEASATGNSRLVASNA